MSKRKSSKAGANLVTSARPDSLELTVYQSGDAVVHENRTVQLTRGKNTILLEGLPTAFVEDSFEINEVAGAPGFRLGPDCFSPADLSVAALLQKAVGGKITLIEQTQQGVLRHTGTLRYILGNQLVLETAEGLLVLPQTAKFELAEEPAGLSSTPSLTLEPTVAEAGTYGLNSSYETGGLSWTPRYSFHYDPKAGVIRHMRCRVKITNNTGADYEDALFKLLDGHNSSRSRGGMRAKGGVRAAAMHESVGGAEAMMAAAPMADSVQAESVGESKIYPLKDGLSIKNGQTKRPYLLVASDIPVDQEFYLPANYGYYPAQGTKEDDAKLPVFVRLRGRNDSEHKLGNALPGGEGSLYQPDSTGKFQKTDPYLYVPALAPGEAFKLEPRTPSSDVKAQRRLVEYHEDPEVPEVEPEVTPEGGLPEFPITTPGGPDVGTPEGHSRRRREVLAGATEAVEGGEASGKRKPRKAKPKPRYRSEVREVTIYNFKADEAVTVNVHEWLPGDKFQWLHGSHDFAEKTSNQGTFNVSVPANGKVTITYGLKWKVN